MHKSATKCNETVGKWCKNKHGASKIIDMLETYQGQRRMGVYSMHFFAPNPQTGGYFAGWGDMGGLLEFL
jgi:hypothetical protein